MSNYIEQDSSQENGCVSASEITTEEWNNCYLRNEHEDGEKGREVTLDSVIDLVLESVEHVGESPTATVNTLGQAENQYKAYNPSSCSIRSLFDNCLYSNNHYFEQSREEI